MRFGLSTHLFHGERLAPAHLDAIADHGFEIVEVFATRTHVDYHDTAQIDALAGALAARGLRAESLHAPICDRFANGQWGRAFSNASSRDAVRTEALRETRLAIEAASRLGCRTVVLHLGLPEGQPIPSDDNDEGAVRRSLETLGAAAASAHVRLALEVMPNRLSSADAIATRLEEDDLGDAGACLDLGHAHLRGGAPEAAERLSGHIVTTHVHDNAGTSDSHLVPFEGSIDWAASLAALWKVGYEGPFVFEVADHGDTAGVLRRLVGARARIQVILDDLARPFEFREEPS
jgi:sugar phosphate isomerase/epimerase